MSENTNAVAISLEERIFQIAAEESHQPRERLDRETSLFDIMDSLGRVEFVMALEDEFELSISETESDKILTVGQAVDAVEAKLREREREQRNPDGDAPPSP